LSNNEKMEQKESPHTNVLCGGLVLKKVLEEEEGKFEEEEEEEEVEEEEEDEEEEEEVDEKDVFIVFFRGVSLLCLLLPFEAPLTFLD